MFFARFRSEIEHRLPLIVPDGELGGFHLRVEAIVSVLVGEEGQVGGGFDYGFGLGVEHDLDVVAVAEA